MLHDSFDLFTTSDRFYVVPNSEQTGGDLGILVIDRITNEIKLAASSEQVPVNADRQQIYGILGIIRLVSGPYLMAITAREEVGKIAGHSVWKIRETRPFAYARTTMHLTEKEMWYNRHFLEMMQLVLNTDAFYYSYTYDLTHSMQRLQHTTPDFKQSSMLDRSDDRFVWNRYLLQELAAQPELSSFCLPVLHGFVGIRKCRLADGAQFTLTLISRRSVYRVGPRFFKRGVSDKGHAANFIESEQLIELENNGVPYVCSHVQLRGSIPLLWRQAPNLKWQPQPDVDRDDQAQLLAFRRHFEDHMLYYQNAPIRIVNLVNRSGREKNVGESLERVASQSNMAHVQYYSFDFHKHCKNLNWDKLSILADDLRPTVTQFGFFGSRVNEMENARLQTGYTRTNCIDSLDRTNVVASILAKISLQQQLVWLKVIEESDDLTKHDAFDFTFKNLWADNGDACSIQYAGTGALKVTYMARVFGADFTRCGKRTAAGGLNDARNALTRYVKNNFMDGYRQDALDLFLGYYEVNRADLPLSLATGPIDSMDWKAALCIFAMFSIAMAVLCVFAAVEHSYQWCLFWLLVFGLCLVIFNVNGSEFVNKPKLKQD